MKIELSGIYEKLVKDDYITQTEALNMFPEQTPREEILKELVALEQEGLVVAHREKKEVIYFLSSVRIQ